MRIILIGTERERALVKDKEIEGNKSNGADRLKYE